MFLSALMLGNLPLADFAARAIREGMIPPGTFLVDLEVVGENAEVIAQSASRCGISLYAMSKQVGRNPEFIRRVSRFIPKWVAVDLNDAVAIRRAGARVGHLGHLVQPGRSQLASSLELEPDVITVFSEEMAVAIAAEAAKRGVRQALLVRVAGPGDRWPPGQEGGMPLEVLADMAARVGASETISIEGVTSYPCLSVENGELKPTQIASSVLRAAALLEGARQINGPGHTCAEAMPLLARLGFTHGEPGHGLTGTTPMHAVRTDLPERVAVAFATEVSHRLDADRVAVIGGGFYDRSHAENARVSTARGELLGTLAPHPPDAIDYYRALFVPSDVRVGDPAVFAFRFQAFATRAPIAVVAGLPDRPRIVGLHDGMGHPCR